jgi:hypothetical protein
MLTQLVRYGRMLKVGFRSARCRVKAHWTSEGSVFAGTISSTCHGIETHVEIETDEDVERVAALLRNAEGGCYAQTAIQQATPIVGTATVNGAPVDYEDYPRRVRRR